MEQGKSVLIVDDHPLFREGLKLIIDRDDSYKVVGEAENGEQGLREAKRLRPDLVIMDISLPDKNGIQVTREIRDQVPESRVFVISMHSGMNYVTEAIQAGALGYMIKGAATDNLMRGLEAVINGGFFIDKSISGDLMKNYVQSPAKTKANMRDNAYSTLTRREQEVMRLLVEGLAAREIAGKLFISPKTAENHRANIMNKLGLHKSIELVRYAAKIGLIDLNRWKDKQ